MNKSISGRVCRNCHNLQPPRDLARWLACEGTLAASPAGGSGNGFGHSGCATGAALQSFLALQQHRCILDGRGLATRQKLLETAAERALPEGNLPRAKPDRPRVGFPGPRARPGFDRPARAEETPSRFPPCSPSVSSAWQSETWSRKSERAGTNSSRGQPARTNARCARSRATRPF